MKGTLMIVAPRLISLDATTPRMHSGHARPMEKPFCLKGGRRAGGRAAQGERSAAAGGRRVPSGRNGRQPARAALRRGQQCRGVLLEPSARRGGPIAGAAWRCKPVWPQRSWPTPTSWPLGWCRRWQAMPRRCWPAGRPPAGLQAKREGPFSRGFSPAPATVGVGGAMAGIARIAVVGCDVECASNARARRPQRARSAGGRHRRAQRPCWAARWHSTPACPPALMHY